MTYNINPAIFSSTYSVPTDVADKYIKIATHTQLKVLLYFMRNISEGIDSKKIADALSLDAGETEDALTFWQQCGMLLGTAPKETEQKQVVVKSTLPSRADVIKRGLEDKQLMFLLQEAQLKFGRYLKDNERQLLLYLYDDHGMDPSVILFLLGYAAREGKCNLTFVKKTATQWLEADVQSVMDAERIITEQAKQNLAWNIVQKTFGIERRNPSTKELELSNLWINEWKISSDMLKAAYDACIDSKVKLSMPYVAKIIETWHKDGITTPEQIQEKKQKQKLQSKNHYAGYDLDLFEKMLNND